MGGPRELRLSPVENGAGTRIDVRMDGSARRRGVSGHPVRCTSKGTLERVILEGVGGHVSRK